MARIYRNESATRQEKTSECDVPVKYGWLALALLAAVIAAFGGSSRPDAAQIVALRPLAALFLIPVFYCASREVWAELRAPLILLLSFSGLVIIQLIPLPPAVWQSLPGREEVANLAGLTGTLDLWRPISMVPARTMNALASLIVPLTALAVVAAMRASANQLLLTIVGLGLANSVLAILQTATGGSEALYPYAITNFGTPVGLFANQNHAAVFGALNLLVIGYLLAGGGTVVRRRWHRGALIAVLLVVLMGALAGGSRAGLLATVLALTACAAMAALSVAGHGRGSEVLPRFLGMRLSPSLLVAVMSALVGTIVALFVLYDRIPALQTLADAGSFDDLRWRILPSLETMIGHYWIFGSGIGSFEEVYHIFEPTALLERTYVNQAHNDWAQLLIEGGVPAMLCLACFTFWVVCRLHKIGGGTRSSLIRLLFWLTFFMILLLASLVDYPLRTPLFQLVAVMSVAVFARQTSRSADGTLGFKDQPPSQENTFAYSTARVNAGELGA